MRNNRCDYFYTNYIEYFGGLSKSEQLKKTIDLNVRWDKWKITGEALKGLCNRVPVNSYSTVKKRHWKL